MPSLLQSAIDVFYEQEAEQFKRSILSLDPLKLKTLVCNSMNEELPPMKSFILPGGHVAVSQLHICRCVCRRSERICVFLNNEGVFIDPLVIKYLNRLSDYLFILSRYVGMLLKVEEIPWKPRFQGVEE